ncbi:hypothetical protein [Bacillus safensis]|uniref:hypothetical protein n=1 Tax=Bacillus safensis TaxID=561879 RepID=UPI002E1F8310|nr:hypothetical protein [Bacillus safensis]
MHLLKRQKTPSMKKGIRQIDPAYPVFVDAVMDGMIQGHLYVDDEVHPLVYFLEASYGIYYVAGRSEAELLCCSAFIVDVYERQKRQNGRFTLIFSKSINRCNDEKMSWVTSE